MKSVHPQLRVEAWLDRWVAAPLLLLACATLLAATLVGAVRRAAPGPILALGVVVGGLFAWAAVWVWRGTRWYRRASWVRETVPAITARASFVRAEPDAVRLTPADSRGSESGPSVQWSMPCALPKWAAALRDGSAVQAFIDPEPGGPIVIETEAGTIWSLHHTPTTTLAAHAPAESEDPMRLLEQRLREQGLAAQADRLAAVAGTAYSSSSELLGDYGLALRQIRSACGRKMDDTTRSAYAAAARAVRAAWPRMKL